MAHSVQGEGFFQLHCRADALFGIIQSGFPCVWPFWRYSPGFCKGCVCFVSTFLVKLTVLDNSFRLQCGISGPSFNIFVQISAAKHWFYSEIMKRVIRVQPIGSFIYAHSLFVVLWLSSVFLNLHPNYSYDVYTNLKNDMKLCGNLSVLLHLYETHEHLNSNFDKYQYPFCTCALTPLGKTAHLAWNVFSVNHSHFRQNSGHSGKNSYKRFQEKNSGHSGRIHTNDRMRYSRELPPKGSRCACHSQRRVSVPLLMFVACY